MIEKIKELREILPIPMQEARTLLTQHEGDIDKSAAAFKEQALAGIVEETGCDLEMARVYYEKEKHDYNRTVSSINEDFFDRDYQPIEGVTKEKLRSALQWLNMVEAEGFDTSLTYAHLQEVEEVMSLIPETEETAKMLVLARQAFVEIFMGYSDDMPIEEFVRRHRKLDDSEDFQRANKLIPFRIILNKDWIMRHLRNLV